MTRRLRTLYRLARRKTWDIDAGCYFAGLVALVVFFLAVTGVIGPTLDAHGEPIHTAKDGGKTAYAARQPQRAQGHD